MNSLYNTFGNNSSYLATYHGRLQTKLLLNNYFNLIPYISS